MIAIPSPRSKKRARIEIIPLIDIVFFLLATFVMVSLSMVKNQGIAVNLPAAASGVPQERSESTTISITANGELFFNRQKVDEAQLGVELRRLKAGQSDPRLFIQGDEKALLGQAIGVLDAIRALGITKVSIQTQPIQAAPQTP